MQNLIVQQVKKIIAKSIARFSKELNISIKKTNLLITPINSTGVPALFIFEGESTIPDPGNSKLIGFKDLITKFDRMTYSSLGFDIEKDTPLWISKFMLSHAAKEKVDINNTCYVIKLVNNKIAAYYVHNKIVVSEVSINEILNTK